jgi:ABC-2 type transport system permease protein
MNAFVQHFSFEFRTGVRNKNLLLLNYLFPLGFYLMMGFVMVEINPLFQNDLIPAMVVFAILAATLLGIPDPLVTARENGIFRSYKINGIPAFSILIIPALTTILHLIIVTAIIVISAPLLFDAPIPVNWAYFTLTFFALAFACSGIAILIGVISASSRVTVLYSQLVFLPSMLLGGLMIPYSMLPPAAAQASQLLPATHAMNAMRGLVMGGSADFNVWISIAVLAISGIMAYGLALYLFSWDRHNTAQRGHPVLALLVLVPYFVGIILTLL